MRKNTGSIAVVFASLLAASFAAACSEAESESGNIDPQPDPDPIPDPDPTPQKEGPFALSDVSILYPVALDAEGSPAANAGILRLSAEGRGGVLYAEDQFAEVEAFTSDPSIPLPYDSFWADRKNRATFQGKASQHPL